MKDFSKNFSLIVLVLITMMMFTKVGIGQDVHKQRYLERKAASEAVMSKVVPLAAERVPEFQGKLAQFKDNKQERQTLNAKGDGGGLSNPAIVFDSTGNTFRGLSVKAYNAVEFPDGTVMWGQKFQDGNVIQLGWNYFSGNMPAGIFRYDMEDGRRATFNEYGGPIIYETLVFFPDGTVSESFVVKPINKWWSGMMTTQKMITSGVGKFVSGRPYAMLDGPFNQFLGPFAVMVKDPDTDYDQRVVPFTIRNNRMTIDLYAMYYDVLPHGEVKVMVSNVLGYTDEYTIRMPGS